MSAGDDAVHVRTIRVEVQRAGEQELLVTGRLVDERPGAQPTWFGVREDRVVHDMSLAVRVRCPELVITAVRADMAAHPYTLCPEALPPLQQLVGLSVSRGFTRAVNERFGRQGAGAAHRNEHTPPRAERDRWFINTCQAWREDGVLAARLRAGDLEGLKALVFRRPGNQR